MVGRSFSWEVNVEPLCFWPVGTTFYQISCFLISSKQLKISNIDEHGNKPANHREVFRCSVVEVRNEIKFEHAASLIRSQGGAERWPRKLFDLLSAVWTLGLKFIGGIMVWHDLTVCTQQSRRTVSRVVSLRVFVVCLWLSEILSPDVTKVPLPLSYTLC